jgi:hypothetical protein
MIFTQKPPFGRFAPFIVYKIQHLPLFEDRPSFILQKMQDIAKRALGSLLQLSMGARQL